MADLILEFTHIPSKQTVAFTAFLEQYADDFAAEWSSDKVFGRMDPVTQYKGTTRKINVAFTVPSESHEEAFINHIKISKLLQMMYPNYEWTGQLGVYTIAAPPLMRVKFNNLIQNQAKGFETYGLMGYIPSLKYDPNLDSNIFSISQTTIDNKKLASYIRPGDGIYSDNTEILIPEENEEIIAFQSFKVAFELNVLHTHALGFNSKDSKANVAKFPMGYGILGG